MNYFVHTIGPDDLEEFATETEAMRHANAINLATIPFLYKELCPRVLAVVHSAESWNELDLEYASQIDGQ